MRRIYTGLLAIALMMTLAIGAQPGVALAHGATQQHAERALSCPNYIIADSQPIYGPGGSKIGQVRLWHETCANTGHVELLGCADDVVYLKNWWTGVSTTSEKNSCDENSNSISYSTNNMSGRGTMYQNGGEDDAYVGG